MDYSSHNINGAGLIVVCAVSGSVVLLGLQAQKRLFSDFIKRMEIQLKGPDKTTTPSSKRTRTRHHLLMGEKPPLPMNNDKDDRHWVKPPAKKNQKHGDCQEMPVNRQVLYRGMINYRNCRGQNYVADYF